MNKTSPTEEEIIKFHTESGFNFGPTSPLDVVNVALLKRATGYYNGSTADSILVYHGLVTPNRKSLTRKGKEYLYNVVTRFINEDSPAIKVQDKSEDLPYIEKQITSTIRLYNKNYGDDRICLCGHPYYRHFDPFEDVDCQDVGCKYCVCYDFKERTKDGKQ